MKQLTPQVVTKIHTYIDEGVPLEDLFQREDQRERVRVAEQVYERFCQDPMLDINRCLRRTFGRSKEQVILDKQVIDIFIDSMEEVSRKMLTTRARKTAESLVRIGQQLGDPKWVDKGLTQLMRLDRLDEEEVSQEDVRNTAALPPVLVDINVVNSSREVVDDRQFQKYIAKYGGKEDDFDKMVMLRARRLQGEDINTIDYEDITPEDIETTEE